MKGNIRRIHWFVLKTQPGIYVPAVSLLLRPRLHETRPVRPSITERRVCQAQSGRTSSRISLQRWRFRDSVNVCHLFKCEVWRWNDNRSKRYCLWEYWCAVCCAVITALLRKTPFTTDPRGSKPLTQLAIEHNPRTAPMAMTNPFL